MNIIIKTHPTIYTLNTHSYYFEYELTGRGTLEEPFSITVFNKRWPLDGFDGYSMTIINSKDYLRIENSILRHIFLTNCENVVIDNIKIKKLVLLNCTDVSIHDSKIKVVQKDSSNRISISNSDIKRLKKKKC